MIVAADGFEQLPDEIRTALVVLVLTVLVGVARILQVALRRIEQHIAHLGAQTEAINKAVNNVPEGTPPIPDRLAAVEERLERIESALGIKETPA